MLAVLTADPFLPSFQKMSKEERSEAKSSPAASNPKADLQAQVNQLEKAVQDLANRVKKLESRK